MVVGLRRISLLLIVLLIISIFPMNSVFRWNKCTEIVHAADTLTREDFKKFEGMIEAGRNHTLILREDGTVATIGSNIYGETKVSGWSNIAAVSAGSYYSVGLKKDGTLVSAGLNTNGQGNVSGWKDIVAISAGDIHTVGLKNDKTVVAVGSNMYGQINVSGWKDIVAISAGTYHTIGLKSDGTVLAVGDNSFGALNVSEWRDIVAISAGCNFTIGLKNDGTVLATGAGFDGQTKVSGWNNIVAISAGDYQTVGLKSDGTIVTAGYSGYSQLNATGWKNMVGISSGENRIAAVRSNGAIVTLDSSGLNDINNYNPKISVNKNSVRPMENVKITILKDKFYTFTEVPTISLSGAISLTDAPMVAVDEESYEINYTIDTKNGGTVDAAFSGLTDLFGNKLTVSDIFKVIPLQSITVSKASVKSGDKIFLTAVFNENMKPGLKISLSGAEDLSAMEMTEVAGSSGTKFIFAYIVPTDYKEGPISVTIQGMETLNGIRYEYYTEENVFIKQNMTNPISSLLVSKNNVKIGETVIITASFTENIKYAPVLSLDGGIILTPVIMTEEAGSNGTRYTYSYLVQEGQSGIANAHITGVYDLNGNLYEEYIQNSLIEIDGTRPSLVNLTSSVTVVKLDNKVKIIATFSEAVKPTVKISLNGAINEDEVLMKEIADSNGKQYFNEYNIKEKALGEVNALIVNMEDLAGNIGEPYLQNSIFTVDGVAPKVSSLTTDLYKYSQGDIVYLLASFEEPIKSGVKASFSGGIENEEYLMNEVTGSGAKQYEMYYEIKSGQKGVVNIALTNIQDIAGNLSTYNKTNILCIGYENPDINNDGNINILDIATVAKGYNQKKDSQSWVAEYDINGDGIIDIFDLVLISKNIQ